MTRTAPWPLYPLGDLVDVLDGRRVPVNAEERARRPGEVPYYGAAGQVGWINQSLFHEDLLLLGEDGVQFFDPAKSKAYRISGPSWVNNHAHVLRARGAVDWRYLEHYLNWFDYRGFANGTTRLKLTQAAMKRIPVTLPELVEQRRIVDILEDHLSRLDAANDYLDAALRRAERAERAVLDRATAIGPRRSLADVSQIQGGIQKQAKRRPTDNPFPFLRVANVTRAGLDLSEVHKVELFAGEIERYRLNPGDLLVVEGNGSASQIGRAAIWDGSIENCVHQNHLIRVRPGSDLVPDYLEAVWNAPTNRAALTSVASSTSGLYTLSVSKLQRLTVPVPSVEAQWSAVGKVRSFRDARRGLDTSLRQAQRRGLSLRRALLAAAFSGRLTGRSFDLDRAEELAFS